MSDKTLGAYERHEIRAVNVDGRQYCPAANGEFACSREHGHGGPHVAATREVQNSICEVWDTETPDDMDGGVAAALIEKEALSGASLAAHFRDKRDMERARAVKAEQERDEALYQRDQWMRGSDSWRATLDEAIEERRRIARALDLSEAVSADRMVERIEEVNGEGRTVTDEMVERARKRGSELAGALWDASVVEAMLTAALTEPPRPEGAEAVQNYLEGFLSGVRFLDDIDPAWLADHLIETLNGSGVRVVT